ncbi:MAG: ABC transporter substrate-binding protein [Nocardioidaceae bacterium]
MSSLRTLFLAVTAFAALLLSACGTTEAPAGAQSADGGEQITLTDSRGKKITLDGPATRTVALEWNAAEHLLSLGVEPVGVSDVQGYNAWVKAEPLSGSVKDVGIRGEPSMDSIASLRPDLIVATTDLPQGAISQLEKLGPVMVLRSADASDGIGQMRENLQLVAEATGSEDKADKLLAAFDAKLAEGREALAQAGLSGDRFFFGDGYVEAGQVYIRPFAEGSLVSDVAERLGMENAWPGKGDPSYGLDETDVEGLTRLKNVDHFVYYHNDKAGGPDPFSDGLGGNAVWRSLPFVKSHDVHRLPDGIWMFGGPASMGQYVDALVAELA